jgi:ATP-dependent DNA helicase RecG
VIEFLNASIDLGTGYPKKRLELVHNLIGGRTHRHLLFFRPSYYKKREFLQSFNTDIVGQNVCVYAKILTFSKKNPNTAISRSNPLIFTAQNANGALFDVILFAGNERYFTQVLFGVNSMKYLSGRLEFNPKSHKYSLIHPEVFTQKPSDFYPIYPLTADLNDGFLRGLIEKKLAEFTKTAHSEHLSQKILDKYNLIEFKSAVFKLHKSATEHEFQTAIKRLAFDEILAFKNLYKDQQEAVKKLVKTPINTSGEFVKKTLSALPYSLTKDQSECLTKMLLAQSAPRATTMLIQGDVGSGKTVISMLAMLNAVENGRQACIMAPTFILANQHYRFFEEYCVKLGLKTVFFSGKDKGKKRVHKLELVSSGEANIVIGTHALFHSVRFKNLGCVVVDEQHRFGVEQRLKLFEKAYENEGTGADVFFMSATPIPRSLALSLYHDIPYFEIRQKPAGRKDIETRVMGINKIDELKKYLKMMVQNGAKIYWVCPLVNESEKVENQSVELRFANLVDFFGADLVDFVHGQMSEDERERRIMRFFNSEVRVLVCTTVIEVGVNVPDATIMVIEDANNFGLSALHQLRGRVGRSSLQSQCFLIYNKRLSMSGKLRLKIMKETNDGFKIASEDLKIRGSGNVIGLEQSGLELFKFANIASDNELFESLNITIPLSICQLFTSRNSQNQDYSTTPLVSA